MPLPLLFLTTLAVLSLGEARSLLEAVFAELAVFTAEHYTPLCVAAAVIIATLSLATRSSSKADGVFSNSDADQVAMMKELCIVVDENDQVVGYDTKKNCHLLSKGLKLHRAFSVFLFDSQNRLMLQKRSGDKITFPHFWANTCCSHPLHTEDGSELPIKDGLGAKRAAIRKLEQELGITADQVPMDCFTFVTRLHYKAPLDETWGEHEIDYLLICRPPVDIKIEEMQVNPNEVAEARYFTQSELRHFVSTNNNSFIEGSTNADATEKISPWFGVIEKRLLHKWWDTIDDLSDVLEPEVIHRAGVLYGEDVPETPTIDGRTGDMSKKQGSYGKVKIHKHSLCETLLRPSELAAVVKYKIGSSRGAKRGALVEHAPATALPADLQFCEDTLVAVSRSFAAVIKALCPQLRLPVAIFYLVLRALDTVEDEMDLARFGLSGKKKNFDRKVTLLRTFHTFLRSDDEWSMTGVGEGDERRLLENYGSVLRVFRSLPAAQQEVIADITRKMGNGMADFAGRDLAAGTRDADEFNLYCHYVAGLVGEGLTRQFVAADLEDPALVNDAGIVLADSMGKFLQKTNIIRDYLEDLVDMRSFWPATTWSQYVPSGSGLDALADASPNSVACLNHMVADALEHANDCIGYLSSLRDPTVFRFCAIPQIMAIATLSECYGNPKVFTGVVKIRKSLAAAIMMDCDNMAAVQKWFAHFAGQILTHVDPSDPNADRVTQIAENLGGRAQTCPAGLLSSLNVLASVVFVAASWHIFARGRETGTVLPRLNDTPDVVILGLLFASLMYLLGFAGIAFALDAPLRSKKVNRTAKTTTAK